MIELKGEERLKIRHLFGSMQETMVQTCLQGHMGRAWTNDLEHPTAALIQVDVFTLIAGTADSEQMYQMVARIPELTGLKMALMIPENSQIGALALKIHDMNCKKILRYSFKKREKEFELDKLQSIVDSLPEGYSVCPIDGTWYEEALKEEWSRDFVANFLSKEDFLNRGIGRIVLHNGKMVSGASSYSVFDGGIEIEIDTRADYRKKGLALVAGAALILACRKKGLYPNWDAANTISVHLAEKLGYEMDQPYDTFIISENLI